MESDYLKGRGAQLNPPNPFIQNECVSEDYAGLDEPLIRQESTEVFEEHSKKILNRVQSPDIPLPYSSNPYQGCEHGCVYCYARVTHQYWGFSSGLDFERKIIVKKNAAELLVKAFERPRWRSAPIMLSGNTDCYQPLERKYRLTRAMLEAMLEYRNPVGIITKNSLILRDLDILTELARLNLVRVNMSITTLDEELRRSMEPRTSSSAQRFKVIETLSKAGVPVSVMVAPVAPGLNSHEIVPIIQKAADCGARHAGFTMMRLNGPVALLFEDWIRKAFPDRADKVLRQIAEVHGGKLGSSEFGTRMRGKGSFAEAIRNVFKMARKKYLDDRVIPPYDLKAFRRPPKNGQLSLFG